VPSRKKRSQWKGAISGGGGGETLGEKRKFLTKDERLPVEKKKKRVAALGRSPARFPAREEGMGA